MQPVILLMRIFLYFVVAVFALSQLNLDLTIIYTFLIPVAWGIGIGLGAAIAIVFWFGLKERGAQIMDQLLNTYLKK
jgi:hypothetical protein